MHGTSHIGYAGVSRKFVYMRGKGRGRNAVTTKVRLAWQHLPDVCLVLQCRFMASA